MQGVSEALAEIVASRGALCEPPGLHNIICGIIDAASTLKVVDCESTRVQETSGPKNDPVLGDIVETVTIRYRREER